MSGLPGSPNPPDLLIISGEALSTMPASEYADFVQRLEARRLKVLAVSSALNGILLEPAKEGDAFIHSGHFRQAAGALDLDPRVGFRTWKKLVDPWSEFVRAQLDFELEGNMTADSAKRMLLPQWHKRLFSSITEMSYRSLEDAYTHHYVEEVDGISSGRLPLIKTVLQNPELREQL